MKSRFGHINIFFPTVIRCKKRAGKNRLSDYYNFKLLPAVRQPDEYSNMQNYSGDINRPEIHMLGFVAEQLHSQKPADRAAG